MISTIRKKFNDFLDEHQTNILFFLALIACISMGVFSHITSCSKTKDPIDLNVYLKEEICFADNIFIKVDMMNVTVAEETEPKIDSDGDFLSSYKLNLGLSIQRRSEKQKNKPVKINSKMFKLKQINLKSKNIMEIFFSSLVMTTMSAMISGTVEGEINIIDLIGDFVEEYGNESIENARLLEGSKFKSISADKNSFEEFELDNQSEMVRVMIHFPIKQEYLESENIIVLAVDTWHNIEKRIFLIPRP